MAGGLPGHEHDFYPIVTDSHWLGSHTNYNDLNEGLPYWFNGLVPLAYMTDDQRFKDQVRNVADYVLSAQGQTLLDCMRMFHEKALDWEHWYTDGIYLKDDLNTISPDITDQTIRSSKGSIYERAASRQLTSRYHGAVSGSLIGDERVSRLSPARGVELWTVVETMFSLSYLYHALGDNSPADQCELAAFNAAGHDSSRLVGPSNVDEMGQTFGLEPNYPCCTVNHPQGYPKFVSAAFVRQDQNGIAHALLGPKSVQPSTKSGVKKNWLGYGVPSTRLPSGWCIPSTQTGHSNFRGEPGTRTGMLKIPVSQGSSEVIVTLAAEVHAQRRANDTVAIYYDTLLYAIPVQYTQTSQPTQGYPNLPDSIRDYELRPTGSWAYAIDPSSLRYNGFDRALSNPLWTLGAPHVHHGKSLRGPTGAERRI
ncbi:hypothetical protein Aspvir_001642 [Aspergillus viridinutans]|uniref:Uncharacterized protein n=1 Tax=Aspergillus viridinutans TaxID=75553 RepID=A0A9P3BN01_ASPVI|nr:uncharacterized protein Aspvir_001642 [Aspergillus viridinutans]GIJ99509.1 hypothetical protein Aspvir_001642 [Aspergillus viridinutans]